MKHDAKKQAYWAEHSRRWQASGVSQRHYCEHEGLSLSSFDRWRRLISKAAKSAAKSAASLAAPQEKQTLVPVQLDGTLGIDGHIVLRSPAGWQVMLPSALRDNVLVQLLARLP